MGFRAWEGSGWTRLGLKIVLPVLLHRFLLISYDVHCFSLMSEVFWARRLSGLWQPVATCGSLWRPVAACGTGGRPLRKELLALSEGLQISMTRCFDPRGWVVMGLMMLVYVWLA